MDKLFDPSTMVEEQIQWFEQAKEMEKEQIKEAYSNGYEAGWDSEDWVPEKYYNETFNTKMREVDAYCRECDAYICDERVTFEECCDVCGTDIEYK